ncbi:hypothetical protein [Burkholderia multivorans]|uniref:hypothetical protein n=1 Tax=Burkholderia multivorans TaxID=87883 RepID=UPI000DABCAB7|nr:hypothetical protein DN473_31315 [Burkholderia multivorans]
MSSNPPCLIARSVEDWQTRRDARRSVSARSIPKEQIMTSENFGSNDPNAEAGLGQESQQGHPGPGSQDGSEGQQGHPGTDSQQTGGQPQGDRGGVGGLDDQHAGRPGGDGRDRQRIEESEDECFGGTQPERDAPA